MRDNTFQEVCSKVMVKAWNDPEFKALLLKDPKAAFRAVGIEFPNDATIAIHENTAKEFHFVLPQKPEGNLSEEQLVEIAGGSRLEKGWLKFAADNGGMATLRTNTHRMMEIEPPQG